MSATASNPQFTMRNATGTDLPRILALLPLLADFDMPEKRQADDLWSADAKLAADILSDKAASAFIDVAEDSDGDIAGVIMVSLREELLSHAPSALCSIVNSAFAQWARSPLPSMCSPITSVLGLCMRQRLLTKN
jgi:hypothetical protein